MDGGGAILPKRVIKIPAFGGVRKRKRKMKTLFQLREAWERACRNAYPKHNTAGAIQDSEYESDESGGLNMTGKTKERACGSINTLKKTDAKPIKILQKDPKPKIIGTGIHDSDSESESDYDDEDDDHLCFSSLNMEKTKERACSSTNTLKKTDATKILQKDTNPRTIGTLQDPDSESESESHSDDDDDDDQVGHNTGKTMGKTRQRAWENTGTPKIKLKQTQKVEKISSPQSEMIRVHGYQVKRSNATILKAIFKKHGDIAAECVLKTDYVLSSILEAVCEVVRQIQTGSVVEKMKELECWLSDAEATNINVTWLRAHLEAIDKRKDSNKKYTLLMEMKQNTSFVKKAAQKDLRERCDELVVAQQRFTTAERCVRVLNLVEKNMNDQIFESKTELDSYVNHPVV